MTDIVKIELEDGKYTYVRDTGTQQVLRYGETWRSVTGDKFVGAMADEIERLRAENAASQAREEQLRETLESFAGLFDYTGSAEKRRREALTLSHDDSALKERLKQERERCAETMDGAARAAAENNDLRGYELLRALTHAIRNLGDEV